MITVLQLWRMLRQIHARITSIFVHPWLSVIFAFVCVWNIQARAQDTSPTSFPIPMPPSPQSGDTITAVPNRPTFSTTAETVQTGVFEIEYGYEAAARHQNINGLLKLGLVKNLELRFANNPLERDAGTAALGDCAIGAKYRIIEQKSALPTISILYSATLPTAGAGLGAEALQHAAGILVTKDFGKHHVDFNESAELRGRPGAGGFDRDYFTALAYSHALKNRLGITAEIAGLSRINAATRPTLSIFQALTYNVSTRLVFDSGCYVAVRGDLPRVTFLGGVTYAVSDLYRHWHLTHR